MAGLLGIARVCHETIRAYCMTLNDRSQPVWDNTSDWQKESTIQGVQFRLNNPSSTPAEQHEAWVQDKVDAGWTHGPRKDVAKKQHPNICAYEELPEAQKIKDLLFQAIVDIMKSAP